MFNFDGALIDLTAPKVMGIVNVTKDSFYDGGRYLSDTSLLARVKQIIAEGADIIDIGACSTRPGAQLVSSDDEMAMLDRSLSLIRERYPNVVISVDTIRAEVAKNVVTNYNVQIVNDISAGSMDSKMFATIAKLGVPYILMHMQGTPSTMQVSPTYKYDVLKEVALFFSEKLHQLRSMGVKDVILDPGFGFGKSLDDNYLLLKHLRDFQIFNSPLLVGISRKSMIYNHLDIDPENALAGTIALNSVALLKGASLLRVHDVKEAVQTIKLITKIKSC